jgi:hypothetical protein
VPPAAVRAPPGGLARLRFELVGVLVGSLAALVVKPVLPDVADVALLAGPALGLWGGIQARAAWVGSQCRQILHRRLARCGIVPDRRWDRFAQSLLVTLAIEEGFRSGPWAMTSPEFQRLFDLAVEAAARRLALRRSPAPRLSVADEYKVERLRGLVEPLLWSHRLMGERR